jgi:transketolase C-terminal domain/subunit
MALLPHPDQDFRLGKASVICEGSDVTFIAAGETVAPAWEAAP